MEEQNSKLAPEFEGRAAPPPERVTVTLDIDADILEWLKAQPLDWQREINNAARFVMETSHGPCRRRMNLTPSPTIQRPFSTRRETRSL